jgi:hypothetical protein
MTAMGDSAYSRITSSPLLRELYRELLDLLDPLGNYEVQTKKSALHITHGPGFLGVQARDDGLLLTIVTDAALDGDRVRRTERVAAGLAHNEVLVTVSADFDDELAGWLAAAYRRAGREPRPAQA